MPIDRVNLAGFLRRLPSLFSGLFLFAVGGVLNLYSGLGMSPWGIFHVGVSNATGLTLGQVTQLTGLAVLLLGWLLGFAPGFGTLMNMIFIGWFTDQIMISRILPRATDAVTGAAMLLVSVAAIGVASLLYLRVRLGAGPRDGLMVGLIRKLNRPVWIVRGSIEVAVLVVGYLLGGPVGVGTVVTAFTVGYSVQLGFRLGGFDGKSPQMNLWELFRHLTEG